MEGASAQTHFTMIDHATKLGSEFFGNFGKASTFQNREYKIINPHKSNTFIQDGDSILTRIGKVALAIVSLTSSLWVSAILDAFHAPDEGQQASLKGDIQTEKKKMLGELFTDVQRNHYIYDGQSFHDRAFQQVKGNETAREALINGAKTEHQPILRDLLKKNTFEALKQYIHSNEGNEQLREAYECLNKNLENSIEEMILPKFCDELAGKYGEAKAAQILDLMHQTLPNTIRHNASKELIDGRLDKKEGPLSHSAIADSMLAENTSTWVIDTKADTLNFTSEDLVIKREGQQGEENLEGASVHGMPIKYASLPLSVKIDLKEMKGTQRMVVNIPRDKLTDQEGIKLCSVWENLIGRSTLPTERPTLPKPNFTYEDKLEAGFFSDIGGLPEGDLKEQKEHLFDKMSIDVPRMNFIVDGKPLMEQGWEAISATDRTWEQFKEKHNISPSPELEVRLKELYASGSYEAYEALRSEGSTDDPAISKFLAHAVQDVLKEEVLPKLYGQLEKKYAPEKALQILNGCRQDLEASINNDFIFSKLIKGKLGEPGSPLEGAPVISRSGTKRSTISLDTKSGKLTLDATLRFQECSASPRFIAKVPISASFDLGTMKGDLKKVIHLDRKVLKPHEVAELTDLWSSPEVHSN